MTHHCDCIPCPIPFAHISRLQAKLTQRDVSGSMKLPKTAIPPQINNVMATRLRNVNIVFFVFAMSIVAIATWLVVMNISQSVARNDVLLYSGKTTEGINGYLSKEIALVSQAAAAPDIVEWLMDEADPQKRERAYRYICSTIPFLDGANLYLGISSSLNEYSFDATTPADFQPYDVLTKDRAEDIWYFEATASDKPYLLNVDVDKLLQRRLVWIDYPVYHEGRLLGVLCTGLELHQVAMELFSEYDEQIVRGIVIDEFGSVQIDSGTGSADAQLFFEQNIPVETYIEHPRFARGRLHAPCID